MKFKILFLLFSVLTILYTGCDNQTEITKPEIGPNFGQVDFSRLVTIGNSITSGYQSGSLFQSAQVYSFGNQIAQKSNVDFVQPLVSDPGTLGRIEIVSLNPFVTKYNTTSGQPVNLTYGKPYNNLGIPGATVYDVLKATNRTNCLAGLNGSPNPMFDLVLRGLGTQFQQAKALNPTFVTLWIGNNDVLGFATSGGTSPSSPIPVNTFNVLYNQLADSIASLNVKTAVGNVPDITVLPFFTTVGPQTAVTVPWTLMGIKNIYFQKHGEGVGTGTADSLALLTGKVLITLKASAYVSLAGLPTGKYYKDNNLTVPAGVDTTKPFALHPQNPLPDGLILDEDEILTAKNTTASYNQIIATACQSKDFVLVDINNKLNQLRANDLAGTSIDGIVFRTTFVTGGIFSLDGVHPSNQGQGIIADEFIKAINNKYNSNIPLINVSTIPGSIILSKKSQKGYYIIDERLFNNLKF